jgi:cell division transport system permease protein
MRMQAASLPHAHRGVPGARFIAEQATVQPLLGRSGALRWLAVASVLAHGWRRLRLAVVLAARGALDTHRSTIEVMHGIGATDEQVAFAFPAQDRPRCEVGALSAGAWPLPWRSSIAAAAGWHGE